MYKRQQEDLRKSVVVTLIAFLFASLSVVALSISESFTLTEIIFEVCSAFGTTGLSMGITPELSNFGKLLLILLMFIGRVGIISFLFMMGGREQKLNYQYPKERIIIG